MLKNWNVSWAVIGVTGMCLFMSACSSTWVVSKDLEGGVIGYRGFGDGNEALAEISKQIQCPHGFVGVSDDLRSEPYTYTGYETVTARGTHTQYGHRGYTTGHDEYQVSVPVTKTATSYWREYRYRCKPNPTNASLKQDQTIRPLAE